MKRLLSIILAVTLVLTLFTACGETEQALTATELLDLGEKYLLDLDYEQAIVYFNQVIEVEPRNSRAYMGAAEAYVGLGDTESAIDILKTALDVFVDDEEVMIEILEMLIEIDPTNVEWYLDLAQIYINQGNTDKAREVLQQGMAKASDTAEIEALLNQLVPDLSELKTTSIYYYDEDGNLYRSCEYEYDQGGNTTCLTTVHNSYNIETPYSTETIDYYDLSGNVTSSTTKTTNSDGVTNVTASTREYDSYGNVTSSTTVHTDSYGSSDTIAVINTYEYDSYGNITSQIQETTTSATVSVTTLNFTYEYDTYGNITSNIATYTDQNGTVMTSTNTYEYDSSGKIIKNTTVTSDGITVITEYDSAGNTISSTVDHSTANFDYPGYSYYSTTAEYDAFGYSISVTVTADGATTTYDIEREYEYGADGKVIKCVMTGYNGYSYWGYTSTGSNIYSVTTLERIG